MNHMGRNFLVPWIRSKFPLFLFNFGHVPVFPWYISHVSMFPGTAKRPSILEIWNLLLSLLVLTDNLWRIICLKDSREIMKHYQVEIVQDAWPTKNMTTSCYSCHSWFFKAYRTWRNLMTVKALQRRKQNQTLIGKFGGLCS